VEETAVVDEELPQLDTTAPVITGSGDDLPELD
jgi:hypothetical protein